MEINFATKEDIQELERKILAELRRFAKPDNFQKEWLRTKEACQLLNCSPGTLQNLRIAGVLPFTRTKARGSIYYNRNDIVKVMEENKKNNDRT